MQWLQFVPLSTSKPWQKVRDKDKGYETFFFFPKEKKKVLCGIYENILLCKNKKFYIWLVLLDTYDWKMSMQQLRTHHH